MSANSHFRAHIVQQPNVVYMGLWEWPTADILSYSSFEIMHRKGFNSSPSLKRSTHSQFRDHAVQQLSLGYVGLSG
jgi:hypothetical protein